MRGSTSSRVKPLVAITRRRARTVPEAGNRQAVPAVRFFVSDDARSPVQFRAGAYRGSGEPAGKAQRLQAEADGIVQCAELFGGIVLRLGDLSARQQAGGHAEDIVEQIAFGFEIGDASRVMRDMHRAVALRLQVDVFITRQRTDEIDRLDLRGDEAFRFRLAVMGDQFAERPAGWRIGAEAAIAARGAPCERTGLDEADIGVEIARQMKRAGEAGMAAADDRDVAGFVADRSEIDAGAERRRFLCPEAAGGRARIVHVQDDHRLISALPVPEAGTAGPVPCPIPPRAAIFFPALAPAQVVAFTALAHRLRHALTLFGREFGEPGKRSVARDGRHLAHRLVHCVEGGTRHASS